MSNEEEWDDNLQKVINYIDKNNKRPSESNKNTQIKFLGSWLSHQQTNYKKKEYIMLNEEIYNRWTEFINDPQYKKYFMSNEEEWDNNLQKVINYIDRNNKRPSESDKNIDIRHLAQWIGTQQQKYKKKEQIMTNKNIYEKWTNFINNKKYEIYFQSNENKWNENLQKVKKYIDDYNKKPTSTDKNIEIKSLAKWIISQQQNYKNIEQIMGNKKIYNKWTEFLEKYKIYFQSNEDIWLNNLKELKNYIVINNKRPSTTDKNKDMKSLGYWLSDQQKNYKNKIKIMSNEEIYNKWTEFINDPLYKKYF